MGRLDVQKYNEKYIDGLYSKKYLKSMSGFYRYVIRMRANYELFEKFKREHLIYTGELDLHMLFEKSFDWRIDKHPVLNELFSVNECAAISAFKIMMYNTDSRTNILYKDNEFQDVFFEDMMKKYHIYSGISIKEEDFFQFADKDKPYELRGCTLSILKPKENQNGGFKYCLDRYNNILFTILDFHCKCVFNIDISDENKIDKMIEANKCYKNSKESFNISEDIINLYKEYDIFMNQRSVYMKCLSQVIDVVLRYVKNKLEDKRKSDLYKFMTVEEKEDKKEDKSNFHIKFRIINNVKNQEMIERTQNVLKAKVECTTNDIIIKIPVSKDDKNRIIGIIYNNVDIETIRRHVIGIEDEKYLMDVKYDFESIKDMLMHVSMADFEKFFKAFDEKAKSILNLTKLEANGESVRTQIEANTAVRTIARQIDVTTKNLDVYPGHKKIKPDEIRLFLHLASALTPVDKTYNFNLTFENLDNNLARKIQIANIETM